jgi:hypothetical protein
VRGQSSYASKINISKFYWTCPVNPLDSKKPPPNSRGGYQTCLVPPSGLFDGPNLSDPWSGFQRARTRLQKLPPWRTEGGDRRGGGEREPNQILLQELIYVSSSIPKSKTLQEGDEHTNQQHRNGRLEVMNAAKKEWDQLDTQLARFSQNRERTSVWNLSRTLSRILGQSPVGGLRGWFFFPKLNEIWTQESSQHQDKLLKEFFSQVLRFPFRFWMNSKN